jgi:putative hydrolase of the HAD superfamily
MTKKYQHIFFDLDHTLWDFESNAKHTLLDIFLMHELEKKGVNNFNIFFERYSWHNKKLWDKYTKGQIKQEELKWKRMYLALLEFKIADEQLSRKMGIDFTSILPNKTILFPYAIEILEYLKNKDYNVHLITNGFEEIQANKLKNTNTAQYFDVVVTSEISNSLKPNKEIFDYALNTTKANIGNSIMIGDNIDADIEGGINAGLDTIYVNHLNDEEYKRANYTIFNLQELENIL